MASWIKGQIRRKRRTSQRLFSLKCLHPHELDQIYCMHRNCSKLLQGIHFQVQNRICCKKKRVVLPASAFPVPLRSPKNYLEIKLLVMSLLLYIFKTSIFNYRIILENLSDPTDFEIFRYTVPSFLGKNMFFIVIFYSYNVNERFNLPIFSSGIFSFLLRSYPLCY